MKTMKSLTVSQAKKLVLKPLDGNERTINEVVHFGTDKPYAEKSIAEDAGIIDAEPNINPFYVILDEKQLTTLLKYLRKQDGYLIEQ